MLVLKEFTRKTDHAGWASLNTLVQKLAAFPSLRDRVPVQEIKERAAASQEAHRLDVLRQATLRLTEQLAQETLTRQCVASWEQGWADCPAVELPDDLNAALVDLPITVLQYLVKYVPEQKASKDEMELHVALCGLGKRACVVPRARV